MVPFKYFFIFRITCPTASIYEMMKHEIPQNLDKIAHLNSKEIFFLLTSIYSSVLCLLIHLFESSIVKR